MRSNFEILELKYIKLKGKISIFEQLNTFISLNISLFNKKLNIKEKKNFQIHD